jgi:hypothetical protein
MSKKEESKPRDPGENEMHSIEVVEMQEVKAFAKIMGQETAQNILSFIAAHKGCTATEIANGLAIPLSTVHYNVKALCNAKVIDNNSFHYSSKGKEVAHYELSKKVLVIVPKKEASLLSQLTTVFPGLLLAGAVGALGVGYLWIKKASLALGKQTDMLADSAEVFTAQAAPLARASGETIITTASSPDIFVGILVGASIVLAGMILVWTIKKTIHK